MSRDFDRSRTLEELEDSYWGPAPSPTTSLVRAVHELRQRPIDSLDPTELARLIGQEIGLPWVLPPALELLLETAPHESQGGWYDEDLLYAVLSVRSDFWHSHPELADLLKETVSILKLPQGNESELTADNVALMEYFLNSYFDRS